MLAREDWYCREFQNPWPGADVHASVCFVSTGSCQVNHGPAVGCGLGTFFDKSDGDAPSSERPMDCRDRCGVVLERM